MSLEGLDAGEVCDGPDLDAAVRRGGHDALVHGRELDGPEAALVSAENSPQTETLAVKFKQLKRKNKKQKNQAHC